MKKSKEFRNNCHKSVLLFRVYVVVLFNRNHIFMIDQQNTESRVTLSFVVKSKLVTVLSLFLFTFLQLPLAASMILGLNYVRSDSRVVI